MCIFSFNTCCIIYKNNKSPLIKLKALCEQKNHISQTKKGGNDLWHTIIWY